MSFHKSMNKLDRHHLNTPIENKINFIDQYQFLFFTAAPVLIFLIPTVLSISNLSLSDKWNVINCSFNFHSSYERDQASLPTIKNHLYFISENSLYQSAFWPGGQKALQVLRSGKELIQVLPKPWKSWVKGRSGKAASKFRKSTSRRNYRKPQRMISAACPTEADD